MEWISVKDQPIPKNVNLLVVLESPMLGFSIWPAHFSNIGIIGTCFDFDMPKVTHWCLAPELK